MKAAVRQWWDGREPREQKLLAALAVLVTLFVLAFGLFLPAAGAVDAAETRLTLAKAELRAVSRLGPSASGSAARTPFDRSVLITVARDQNVKLTSVQPGADGSFAVRLDDVQTVPLYAFFEALITDYAVSVERVQVTADAGGRLSAQMTVR